MHGSSVYTDNNQWSLGGSSVARADYVVIIILYQRRVEWDVWRKKGLDEEGEVEDGERERG